MIGNQETHNETNNSSSDTWGRDTDYSRRVDAARKTVNVRELKYLLICDQEQDKVTRTALLPYNLLPPDMQLAWSQLSKYKTTVDGISDVVIVDMVTRDEIREVETKAEAKEVEVETTGDDVDDNISNKVNYDNYPNRHVWSEFVDGELEKLYKVWTNPIVYYGSFSYEDLNSPDKVRWQDFCKVGLVTDGSFDDVANYNKLSKQYQEQGVLYDSVLFLQAVDSQPVTQKYRNQVQATAALLQQQRSHRDYYLFCMQQSNFQTRSLLMPGALLPERRLEQWSVIKSHCVSKDATSKLLKHFVINNDSGVNEDKLNIAVINLVWKDRCGSTDPKDKSWASLCYFFEGVADNWCRDDGELERYYGDYYDHAWQKFSYNSLCTGFNHVKNYLQLLQLKSWDQHDINIVDSLLVLSSDDGRIRRPTYETSDAMMYDLYIKPALENLPADIVTSLTALINSR